MITSSPVIASAIAPTTVTYRPLATDVSQAIFVADAGYQVTGVRVVFGVASVSGTVQVEKLTGTTAPASGTNILTGTVSLSGTANTVQAGTLSGTVANLQLATGDRLGIVFGGTLTSLIGSIVTVTLIRI